MTRRCGVRPRARSSRTAAVAAATAAPTVIRVICQSAMPSAVSPDAGAAGSRRHRVHIHGPRAGIRTLDAARAQVTTARTAASPVQPHRGLPYTPGT